MNPRALFQVPLKCWTTISIILALGCFVYYMLVSHSSFTAKISVLQEAGSSVTGRKSDGMESYFRQGNFTRIKNQTNEEPRPMEWDPLTHPINSASEWPTATGHRVPKEYVEDLPVCSAIVQGDMAGGKDDVARLLGSKERLSEDFYLGATKDCKAYTETRGFITEPLSAEERDFPIAYSMVIHDGTEMFERLLRTIYHPQNVYCVHVDGKSLEGFREAVRAIVSCFPNVFVASKLERVSWGTWSLTQANLNCMDDLLKSPIQWKYLLNACGSDLPIKTNAEMVQTLKLLNGKNSLMSDYMPASFMPRWQYHHKVNANNSNGYTVTNAITRTGIRKTRPPIPVFAGSNFFVVTREFVKHVLENKEAQNFMEWTKDTFAPEEHVWASLNRLSSVPGSVPAHRVYHLSNMNTLARLVHWSGNAGDVTKGAAYPPCTSTVRREVCVYGVGDLRWIFQQRQLMANKFDPKVDDTAIRCIESILCFKALHYSQNLMAGVK